MCLIKENLFAYFPLFAFTLASRVDEEEGKVACITHEFSHVYVINLCTYLYSYVHPGATASLLHAEMLVSNRSADAA